MIDQLRDTILDFLSQFIIPDWGALIGLLPVFLLILVIVWAVWTIRRFATAGPTRRGKTRVVPVAPPGIHMPGGSFAPILAATGTVLLFWGLVVGGSAVWLGVIALTITLLYWGAEGLRDYDHLTHEDATRLPAVVHAGPPPGVHMPGPSFRPILAAIGVTVLFLGLVYGGWVFAVGIGLTVVSLLGWLVDARKEYVKVEEADQTGHIENIPAPGWPRMLLWAGALVFLFAVLFDQGIIPPRADSAAGGGPGASGPPASGEPQPSGSGPAGSPPAGDVVIVAQGVAFTTPDVAAPGPDFTIAFDNQDSGTPHDVDIVAGDGSKLFDGQPFPGPKVEVYEVKGIPAGAHPFICSIHPNMKGTITVP